MALTDNVIVSTADSLIEPIPADGIMAAILETRRNTIRVSGGYELQVLFMREAETNGQSRGPCSCCPVISGNVQYVR